VVAEAVGGFLSITGPKSDGDSLHQPCKAGVAVVDALTGVFSFFRNYASFLNFKIKSY
jgi:crotonobetainyl-CoA:carnitine CoA-transferase CaiB-like acyl-CoA transferase